MKQRNAAKGNVIFLCKKKKEKEDNKALTAHPHTICWCTVFLLLLFCFLRRLNKHTVEYSTFMWQLCPSEISPRALLKSITIYLYFGKLSTKENVQHKKSLCNKVIVVFEVWKGGVGERDRKDCFAFTLPWQ